MRKSYCVLYRTYVQVELDNTAAEFRRLHTERQDLVRQWQNAIDGMRRRDEEINAVGEKYAAARQVRASRIETLAQNAARLKMQTNDNKEVICVLLNERKTMNTGVVMEAPSAFSS